MKAKRQKPTPKKRTLTKEALIKAIDGSFGNITFIAKRLKCHRSTVHDNVTKFDLSELIKEEREIILDLAETQLVKNIKAGKEASIFFTLKCLGKHRGYIERSEIGLANSSDSMTEMLRVAGHALRNEC